MDLSLLRVLEALYPGPAQARILTTTYGMQPDEAIDALSHAIQEGLAQEIGPRGYQLTPEGHDFARGILPHDRLDHATEIADQYEQRDLQLRRYD